MKLRIISEPPFASGIALTGVDVTRVADETAAAAAIAAWAGDADVGMILVEQTLYRRLPRELLARFDRHPLPILAPLPGRRWDERSEAEAYILGILQQAIGYRVRPR